MKTVKTYAIFQEDETQDKYFKTLREATQHVKTFDRQARVISFEGKAFGRGKQIAEYAYNGVKLTFTEKCYRDNCDARGLFSLGVCERCEKKYGIKETYVNVPTKENEEEIL